ncbi:MAG: Coenzyme F420 hydrogenase/dehydrogenase, beta subunit C-terminal domain [Litoreibacter sp.]|nr:Coenzyme F420 hydrogenase/dehydrogenase, beta subunit C-terminal domain [Litoreibacter sp.]
MREITEKIVAADLCAGCGACAALAPKSLSFGLGEDGFLRPTTRARLQRRAQKNIAAICPGQQQIPTQFGDQNHPVWGSYRKLYEGWASDPAIRFEGASGGALTGVLAWLLETGEVDGVLSTSADPDNPIGNRTVISRTKEDLLAQAASRYAPSAPLLQVPGLLEKGERLAFVGKPCDVAGLRNWARVDKRVDDIFPVKLAFFCAGVPSQRGAETLLRVLGTRPEDVSEFRYRGRGWPGRSEARTKQGASRSLSYSESWGDVLSKHVQPRCRICADGIGLEADIVFADSWAVNSEGYPEFEERDGRSLILARSRLGLRIAHGAAEGGALVLRTSDIDAVAAMQPGQLRRRQELLARLIGRVLGGLPAPRYRQLGIWQNSRALGLPRMLRVIAVSMRRAAQRRSGKA